MKAALEALQASISTSTIGNALPKKTKVLFVALDRIILGVCEKKRFLDLFENFILFDNSMGKVVKLIARNHQFIGVNKAIENIQHKEQLYKLGKISLEEK